MSLSSCAGELPGLRRTDLERSAGDSKMRFVRAIFAKAGQILVRARTIENDRGFSIYLVTSPATENLGRDFAMVKVNASLREAMQRIHL